jgi:hypothetical protein
VPVLPTLPPEAAPELRVSVAASALPAAPEPLASASAEGYADTAKPKSSNLLKIIAGITAAAAALAGLFSIANLRNRRGHKKGEDDEKRK